MLTAIVITLAIVALGYGLRQVGLVPDDAWVYVTAVLLGAVSRIVVQPCRAPLGSGFVGSFILTLAIGCAVIIAYAVLTGWLVRLDGPSTSSPQCCGIRSFLCYRLCKVLWYGGNGNCCDCHRLSGSDFNIVSIIAPLSCRAGRGHCVVLWHEKPCVTLYWLPFWQESW